MVTLASVATATAERFPVLPLVPGAKPPAVRRGVHAATQDPGQIHSWWQRLPHANIGVRTGNGVLGIDLDCKNDGNGWVELVAYAHHAGETDAWLDTYTVTTPSRGTHLYYSVEVEVPNRVAVLPGVDVRGEDGYLVAAYSRIGGRHYLPEVRYTETVAVEPDGTASLARFAPELAPAPGWLLELVTRPKRASESRVFPDLDLGDQPDDTGRIRDVPAYLEAVLLGERSRLLAAEPGTRNDTLNLSAFRLGRHVAAGRLDLDQAEAWLLSTASQMRPDDREDPEDPTEAALLATIRSGLAGGMRNG